MKVFEGWHPIDDDTPWMTEVEVMNEAMQEPLIATRGFATKLGVHPDHRFFTTVPQQHPSGFFTPWGNMVCATKWRPLKEEA